MKKSIQTLIALLAVAAVILSFAACGNKTSGNDATNPSVTASDASPASDTSAAAASTAGTTAVASDADQARAVLSEAIAGARAYYDSIKDDEALAEIADDLDTRLQRAEALLASNSATATELASMLLDVTGAVNVAREMAGDSDKATTDKDGQNPVMDYVGVYECERCSITVEADGDTDAKISVHWGSSATEASTWTMSGYFDPDTMRINYSDGVRKDIVIDNENDQETVVYENGLGRIQFLGDGKLEWQDEQEADNVRGMVFRFVG